VVFHRCVGSFGCYLPYIESLALFQYFYSPSNGRVTRKETIIGPNVRSRVVWQVLGYNVIAGGNGSRRRSMHALNLPKPLLVVPVCSFHRCHPWLRLHIPLHSLPVMLLLLLLLLLHLASFHRRMLISLRRCILPMPAKQ